MVTILIAPVFHFHPYYKEIYHKVQSALVDFPEIKKLYITAFYPKKGSEYENSKTAAIASGGPGQDNVLAFNAKVRPTTNTIYHELYHFVQYTRKSGLTTKKKDLEQIEIDATLLGTARLSPSKVENNNLAYFGAVPHSKVVKYAQMARNEKQKGNKHYVSKLVAQVDADEAAERATGKWKSARWKPKFSKDLPVKAKFDVYKGGHTYVKGHTPSAVNAKLQANVKKSRQEGLKQFVTGYSGDQFAYDKTDLLKVPDWMKSSKRTKKHPNRIETKQNKEKVKSKPSKQRSPECSKKLPKTFTEKKVIKKVVHTK
jgi:hypothetical protein